MTFLLDEAQLSRLSFFTWYNQSKNYFDVRALRRSLTEQKSFISLNKLSSYWTEDDDYQLRKHV